MCDNSYHAQCSLLLDIGASALPPEEVTEAMMGWPFCPQCRATLAVNGSGEIRCECCHYESNLSSFSRRNLPSTKTVSSDTLVPTWARSEEEQAALQASRMPTRATVEEPCVKCNHPEVGFYTVQLRSVDEGQTVFYECPSCKHTWSLNN